MVNHLLSLALSALLTCCALCVAAAAPSGAFLSARSPSHRLPRNHDECRAATPSKVKNNLPTNSPLNISSKRSSKWNDKYDKLCAYKREHGDCLVPVDYVNDKQLGHWVRNQRAAFTKGNLLEDRKAKLDSVGFVWSANEYVWVDLFKKLQQYRRKHGDCLVPGNYLNDKQLGPWVNTQRQRYKKGTISIDEKKKLESIGFVWSVIAPNWSDDFEKLLQYRREHGDCLVPYRYAKDRKLGTWVNYQRQRYRTGTISIDEKKKLDSIGFVWSSRLARVKLDWDDMFEKLCAYKRLHGDCLVPYNFSEDRQLGTWVNNQRQTYKNGKMREDRHARLDSIGFVWNASRRK